MGRTKLMAIIAMVLLAVLGFATFFAREVLEPERFDGPMPPGVSQPR